MTSGKTNPPAVFFGSGPVAARSLELLLKHTAIEAVITKPRPAHHRGSVPVLELAEKVGLKIFTVSSKTELDQLVESTNFDSKYGILIDFGIIVSQKVIDSFDYGIINSHFSLLPHLRGADPITWSIANGDSQTGVSLMLIDKGMDTGQLLTQQAIDISPNDTSASLTEKLIGLSDQLLQQTIGPYLDGQITAYDQPNPDQATYSRKLQKSDGIIDWSQPAELIERQVRAFADWPQCRTKLGDVEVIITSAKVVNQSGVPGKYQLDSYSLTVYAGQKALSINSLKPLGKKEMPIRAFLAGYKAKL